MTLAMDTGRGGGVGGPRTLFEVLHPYVEEWFDEFERSEPAGISAVLLVLERFEDLLARMHWFEERARRDFGLDCSGFEAVVALCGIQAAAGRCGVPAAECPAPPDQVTKSFLALWGQRLIRCHGVTASQVAVAYLGAGWSPDPVTRYAGPCWEPARVGFLAMTYKAVKNGLHTLANNSVPPLVSERCQQRSAFDQRVQAVSHSIVLALVSPQPGPGRCGPSIGDWDCKASTLWAFVFEAVLGPGHAGSSGNGGRPLAGAYTKSLLGRRLEPLLGITVKTVEHYFCATCCEAHADPDCSVDQGAVVMATSYRNRYVTPKDRLPAKDRAWGHEEVRRNICKNPSCRDRLLRLVEASGRRPGGDQQPLYDSRLARCPYCGEQPTRWRKTVWTRHP